MFRKRGMRTHVPCSKRHQMHALFLQVHPNLLGEITAGAPKVGFPVHMTTYLGNHVLLVAVLPTTSAGVLCRFPTLLRSNLALA